MKSKFGAVLLATALSWAQNWQIAAPGYHYDFPRDHFSHPDYQTEWWYYTGNLHAADGHRYGFELTFFREAVHVTKDAADAEGATWRPDEIYLAHLAFSDIDGGEFYHTERLNRAGPGLAGATNGLNDPQQKYWNGNWHVRWSAPNSDEQVLEAVTERLRIGLTLKPEKPFVIHGQSGLSVKGALAGEASHYVSFTRMRATGQVEWKGTSRKLEGLAWMDHEFFTEPPDNTLAGWDWFAIQLDNKEELMLYCLRTRSGQASRYSSGTYVDGGGKAHFLGAGDFALTPIAAWRSTRSGASYPIGWKVEVPSLELELSERAALKDQELFSANGISPSYWEGAVSYEGRSHSERVRGVGYLEMTGYSGAVQLGGR